MQPEINKHEAMGIAFLESLTKAEIDVFFSMTEGCSYTETAELLNIKVSTLKKHRENICNKIRDILAGQCSCPITSGVGYNWLKFALAVGILDGQKWLNRLKKKPLCRD